MALRPSLVLLAVAGAVGSMGASYRTQNFVLNQVTVFAPSGHYRSNLDYNLGFFLQDRWRMGRLAVSPGVRFEFQKESNDPYTAGPTKYTPARNLAFPSADVVKWKEVNPRIGVSYDLFGNGKTAVKASAARGVAQEGINTADSIHPAVALSTSVARNVVETTYPVGDPRRLNNVADCDLLNPAANGECGPWLTSGFGGTIPVTQQDPRTLRGRGVRPWNWEFSTGFQHQLTGRISAGLTYYRRINGGFLVTDNITNTAADFQQFTVTVPSDSRLPTSGQKLTAEGKKFYRLDKEKRQRGMPQLNHERDQYHDRDGQDQTNEGSDAIEDLLACGRHAARTRRDPAYVAVTAAYMRRGSSCARTCAFPAAPSRARSAGSPSKRSIAAA